jgi:hypothetical protein
MRVMSGSLSIAPFNIARLKMIGIWNNERMGGDRSGAFGRSREDISFIVAG